MKLALDKRHASVWILALIIADGCRTSPPATAPERDALPPAPVDAPRSEPSDDPTLVALTKAADEIGAARRAGDLDSARARLAAIVQDLDELHPASNAETDAALTRLAEDAAALLAHEESLALCSTIVALRDARLPAGHPDRLTALFRKGVALRKTGDTEAARAAFALALAGLEPILPRDHPDLLRAKLSLASATAELGDPAGALPLFEEVVALQRERLPPDHPELLSAMQNLAVAVKTLGDLERALVLEEAVLAARSRALPADHPAVLRAKQNLAATKAGLGDVLGARVLEEDVLAQRMRTLPIDHPDLLDALNNLAVTRAELGDIEGARVLQEQALAGYERARPEGHRDVLIARLNVAMTYKTLGDVARARGMLEGVVTGLQLLFPDDHPDVLLARANLATSLDPVHDAERQLALEEEVLEGYSRIHPKHHEDVLRAMENLAVTRQARGDFAGACALEDEVLAIRERTLPRGHRDLLRAKGNAANMRADLGNLAAARVLRASLLDDLSRQLESLAVVPPREARESAREVLSILSESRILGDALQSAASLEQVYDVIETARHLSSAGADVARAASTVADIAPARDRVLRARAELQDFVLSGADTDDDEAYTRRLRELVFERDDAERDLRTELTERGALAGDIRYEDVRRALAPKSAAVSFLRCAVPDPSRPEVSGSLAARYLAWIVLPDQPIVVRDLGSAAEIDGLVMGWRSALGEPVFARSGSAPDERGTAASSGRAADPVREVEMGRALRGRILDPVREIAGDARTLYVCLDDALQLAPIEALPSDGAVGESEVSIRHEISFAPLIRRRAERTRSDGLCVLGGIDYDADVAEDATTVPVGSTAPIAALTRGAGMQAFGYLPESLSEVRTVADIYRTSSGIDPRSLEGAQATKSALRTAVSGARYVHIATHGWFAPEDVRSRADSDHSIDGSPGMLTRGLVTGLAPMTLCGLALAGANLGADASGRVTGIMTAEELAALDLAHCELAVLSACETNVGVRRAGQGVQSLQAALLAAGAESAITSLWKVGDAATRRLMEEFYTRLWQQGLPASIALSEAKLELARARDDAGRPVYATRDWAAWVLTGATE